MPRFATASGCCRASATVAGSLGQPGAIGSYPSSRNLASHGSQLVACSHSPCMNTTGRLDSVISDPFLVGRQKRTPIELPTSKIDCARIDNHLLLPADGG